MLDGHDPIAARREQRTALKLEAAKKITFDECAEAYVKAHPAERLRKQIEPSTTWK